MEKRGSETSLSLSLSLRGAVPPSFRLQHSLLSQASFARCWPDGDKGGRHALKPWQPCMSCHMLLDRERQTLRAETVLSYRENEVCGLRSARKQIVPRPRMDGGAFSHVTTTAQVVVAYLCLVTSLLFLRYPGKCFAMQRDGEVCDDGADNVDRVDSVVGRRARCPGITSNRLHSSEAQAPKRNFTLVDDHP